MKFLCTRCDEAMKLETASPPDGGGSLAATFRCPACGAGVAMLTNPWETEVVRSLGVRIGRGPAAGEGGEAAGCPFSGMVREMEAPPAGIGWTAGALARLERIPEFVRPMARAGVEQYARSQGRTLVTEQVLDEARGGMDAAGEVPS